MSQAPLGQFHLDRGPAKVPLSSRVTAVLLTAALYALVAWMVPARSTWKDRPPSREIYANVREREVRRPAAALLPPFLAHLIKPRAQTASPPAFTIVSNTPPPQMAPSPQTAPGTQASLAPQDSLPPTMATSSPLAGGAQTGSGIGQGGTANGIIGVRPAGCYDAAWAQSVTDHIRKFFFYPQSEKRRRVTGQVFVHIGMRRNGRLAFLKVNRSSGVRALDQAALEMVRRALPLPRIPDRMHLDRIDVELPILFGAEDKSLKPMQGDCDLKDIFNRDT